MAKLKYGILGPISGKLGPVVGGTWKGIPYLRPLPQIKKDRPKSEAQIANEQKFKFANDWMVPFHPYMSVGFENLAIQKTAISAAFSANYHNAITGVYPHLGVDYAKVMISSGSLPVLDDLQVVLTAPDTVKITWSPNCINSASYDDQLMVAIYCPDVQLTDGFIGGIKRSAKQCVFQFYPKMIGKALEIYVGVTSLDRKKIAESVYLGRIAPL